MDFKKLTAEFIGTFGLIFIGVGAIAANFYTAGDSGLVGIALAHGLTIAVMVGATASISGGHINPAVTIGLLSAKKIKPDLAIGYIIAQCLGAIAAAILIKICVPVDVLKNIGMGTPALGVGISAGKGLMIEIILTFFLVFVIYGTAVNKGGTALAPLLIGLTVTLDILMGGPLTGAAMNPARHLGPALLGGGLENLWLYWIGPVLGGLLAAQVYHRILEEKS